MMERHVLLTHGPNKLFDVTGLAARAASHIGDGVVAVFSKGSTGALVVIPRDAAEEYEYALWDLVDMDGWEHPGNAYAHLRSTLLGTSLVLPVSGGELCIPTGYGVFFVENQPANVRRRVIYVAAIPRRPARAAP